jgi:hypothetical protein
MSQGQPKRDEEAFDTALVCLNGHVVTRAPKEESMEAGEVL